jgi:hypothetical protein
MKYTILEPLSLIPNKSIQLREYIASKITGDDLIIIREK